MQLYKGQEFGMSPVRTIGFYQHLAEKLGCSSGTFLNKP